MANSASSPYVTHVTHTARILRAAFLILLTELVLLAPVFANGSQKSDRKVVVIVWDGMRPDFIDGTNTPTLFKLAHEGVTFTRHHSTYLSATEVNGTAIATGNYPGHSGLIGNAEYRPLLGARKPTHTEVVESIRKGD